MYISVSENISVFQSCLWQLNSAHIHYLDTSIVIDPAYLPAEIQAIADNAINPLWTNRFLVYTHGDFDHIVGNNWFDGFEHVGSSAMAERIDINRILSQIESFDHENYISRPYPTTYPDLDHKLNIEDSKTIKIGSVEIIVFKAGGHTSDGLFYIIPELKLWIAGDYLSDIEFPFVEDSVQEYYKTMERAKEILNQFDIEFLIPGHGSIAFTRSEMTARIERSISYLDSLNSATPSGWRVSWGYSPFEIFLDKMHEKNVKQAHKS